MTTKDIVWLAGILEGEGSFTLGGRYRTTPSISMSSVDLDVVEKVSKILDDCHICNIPYGDNNKIKYSIAIYSNTAVQWMMTLYPLMMSRRQRKIKEILELWKSTKPKYRNNGVIERYNQMTPAQRERERLVKYMMEEA